MEPPEMPRTDGLGEDFNKLMYLIGNLRKLVLRGLADEAKTALHFHPSLRRLESLLNAQDTLVDVLTAAPRYDFKDVKANGYRSIGKVVIKCISKLNSIVQVILEKKDSYLFKKDPHLKELSGFAATLEQLNRMVAYAHKLMSYSDNGELFFPANLLDSSLGDEMEAEIERLDQRVFYGRGIGFQFCDSMKRPMEVIHLAMATYSSNYQEIGRPYLKLIRSVFRSVPYMMNPEKRAQQVVDAALRAEVSFCKALWSLSEDKLMTLMTDYLSPALPVEAEFSIDPNPVTFESGITVSPPTVHNGLLPLQLRLLSNEYRTGQEEIITVKSPQVERSPYLLFHCHGGGFIAHTSKSHLPYIRLWSKNLNVPTVCVDYSLAPESPFPRASEEVFFAYAWAIKNCHQLGSTAERVCLVGDSAGGNLLMSVLLRCAETGVRMPDGFMPIYTPTYVQFIPSPSRIISMADPLLPTGILTRCLEAYASARIEKCRSDPVISHSNTSLPSPHFTDHPTMVPLLTDHTTAPTSSHSIHPSISYLQNGRLPTAQHSAPTAPSVPAASLSELDDSIDTPHQFTGRLVHTHETDGELVDSNIANDNQFTDDNNTNNAQHNRSGSIVEDMHSGFASISLSENEVSGYGDKVRTARSGSVTISMDGIETQHRDQHSYNGRVHSGSRCSNDDDGSYTADRCSVISLDMTSLDGEIIGPKFPRVKIAQHPYLSPVMADEELLCKFPPIHFVASHLDPCLDDSVTLARRLDAAGVSVKLDAFSDLPHGFLSFFPVSDECREALGQIEVWLGQLLGVNAEVKGQDTNVGDGDDPQEVRVQDTNVGVGNNSQEPTS